MDITLREVNHMRDLNWHVGQNSENFDRVHDDFCYEIRNEVW